MKRILTLLLSVWSVCSIAQTAAVHEYDMSFPTYPFSDPNPIPLLTPVYPYFRFDGFTDKPVDKKWKVVELENAYIKLLILPEVGGKIWAAIEKSTNRPFLYYNHAVKFRDVAMRGPWTSGGLEANYGIIGHTPAVATPVDYYTRVNDDGSVSCFIGNLDLLTRSNWRVEIRLPSNEAVFSTSSFWYNGSPIEQPYYQWMNAGLKAGDDLEFVYPGNKYLGHNGEHAAWPIDQTNGKKINWYRENNFGGYKSYHVFGKYTDFAGAYWHNDDLGMVRYGDHDERAGKKIWIWGLSRQGMIWEHLLTDTDGQYVELQSGRLFNQNAEQSGLTPFKHRSFAPYGTDTWTEYWYPVLGTKGYVAASAYGALNIRTYASSSTGARLRFDFCPTRSFSDTLTITAAGRTLYKKLLHFHPLQVVSDSLALQGATYDSIHVTLGKGLLSWSAAPDAGDLSRPVDAPAAFDWTSVYGHFLKGCEAVDMKNFPAAEASFDSALQKDPYYLPALVKKASLCYRNLQYEGALQLAKTALSIHSDDGEANYIYGLVNLQLMRWTDARDGFDIATIDPSFRSAAYTQLAKIYLLMNNNLRSLECSRKALDAQPQNVEALQLQALAARLDGNSKLHGSTLERLLALDPLNHFAGGEKYLKGITDATGFTSLVRNELPQETYLELAIWYAACGQKQDALKILSLSPSVAEVLIWHGWLSGQPVDTASLDPKLVFTFRSETANVLQTMLAAQPNWFLRYQLALIYKDRNRISEARQLLQDCGETPNFAPLYAVRAALAPESDSSQALRDLEHAARLDPQWRYQKLLAEFALSHDQPAKAETIAGDFYKKHSTSYIMGMLYAKALLINHHYAQCDALLNHLEIIPFEGATGGRELYREAKLMMAVAAKREHQYKKALGYIAAARRWPENLGVGEPYLSEQDLRLEDWMEYRCYTAQHQQSAAKQALQRILAFQPRIDNTVANFIASNEVITGWATALSAGSTSVQTNTIAGKDANARVLKALEETH